MLRYLSQGSRTLGRWPIHAHRRANWEFYAVLQGRCGVLFDASDKLPLAERKKLPLKKSHLWVFPPGHHHGWYGVAGETCSVASFHYSEVPSILEESMLGQKFLEVPLKRAERHKIGKMVGALQPDYLHPSASGHIRAERSLLDLVLMILADMPASPARSSEQIAEERVNTAIFWFKEHMRDRPSIADIAAAVGVSPTHLRRLFYEVREENPLHTMNRIRLDAAIRLLSNTDELLESISSECGFTNASALCRAFKASRGCTPTRWRKRAPDYQKSHRMNLKKQS